MRLLTLAAAITLALPFATSADARSDRPLAPASADLRGSYIVSFDEPAAPLFRGFQAKDGRRPALAPVSIALTGQPKYDPERPEAEAYLAHPVLGPRLRESARRLATTSALRPITLIVSPVDALKVRSSMTLFTAAADAAGDNAAHADFQAVLDRFYDGEPDSRTLDMLRQP